VEVYVGLTGREDLSGEIYRHIRGAILRGKLRPGEALPPTRVLARQLSVARSTVSDAYDRLWSEGLVEMKQGAGTFVSAHVPRVPEATESADARQALQPRPVWSSFGPSTAFSRPARFDFRTGLPDASLFPYETWRRLHSEELRAEVVGKGVYGDPAGHAGLREAIARHIAVSRGLEASPDDILITNGSQQALDLIARVLLAPGDSVAVEDPGYTPPRLLFTSLGLEVKSVPVDSEGLVVDQIPAGTHLVYITPSHQYPLGMSMSFQRRLALLAWADANGAAIIEDDYDSEFRFGGRPIEPLQTLDSSSRVVYVGSFSKTLLPVFRLGFIVAPASLREALRRAKYVTDWHTALPTQEALALFIENGGFARHLRRMRGIYEHRRDQIMTWLTRELAEHLEVVPSGAGIHLAGLARKAPGNEVERIVSLAADRDVAVQSLSWFTSEVPLRPGVVLGYGAIATDDVQEGLSILKSCFESA
jgi:GntR family transcriptional regulator/MocR family aminotransferase